MTARWSQKLSRRLERLKANTHRLEYDFGDHVGCLWLGDWDDYEMGAVIEYLRRIDPAVGAIKLFAGGRLIMTYQRHGDEEWKAEGAKPWA